MKKLTFEEIRSITFGALSVKELCDGIHFYKCTENQNNVWSTLSKDFGDRALATTGVRFDFFTNSKYLQLNFIGGSFEVLLDGLLTYKIKPSNNGEPVKINLGDEEKRIQIIFPSHSIGIVQSLEVDDDAYIKPSEFSTKMLFIGDSITQGWASTLNMLSYAYRVGLHFDSDFVIQGIGGAAYHKDTFDISINYDPDIVFVAYGTNDYFHHKNVETVLNNTFEYLSRVKRRYNDKRLIVITPLWRADMEKEPLKDNFIKIIDGIGLIAAELEIEVIDGMKLVPHMDCFFRDEYLHPNDTGFGFYADNLIKYLS